MLSNFITDISNFITDIFPRSVNLTPFLTFPHFPNLYRKIVIILIFSLNLSHSLLIGASGSLLCFWFVLHLAYLLFYSTYALFFHDFCH